MASRERLKMIQQAQARLMRRAHPPRPKRESAAEELREPLSEEVSESPEYERREHGGKAPMKKSRTGTMASSGASVGGGT